MLLAHPPSHRPKRPALLVQAAALPILHLVLLKAGVLEPGTQGEHKISRGFSPETTWSAHWLAHPEFADAVSRYLDEEARHVDRYMDVVESRSPYKTVE